MMLQRHKSLTDSIGDGILMLPISWDLLFINNNSGHLEIYLTINFMELEDVLQTIQLMLYNAS